MRTLILFLLIYNVFSQNIIRIRSDIRTLSSPSFYGRGYVNDGHSLSAKYIKKRFIEAGLSPVPNSDSYFQEFGVDAYVIEDATCCISGTCLKIGTQFIPHYASGNGCENSLKAIYVKSGIPKYYPKNVKGKVVILKSQAGKVPKKFSEYKKLRKRIEYAIKQGVSGIIILEKKPVHSILANHYIEPYSVPVIRVFENSIKVRRKQEVKICVSAKWEKVKTQNILGFKKGSTDSIIIIGAHYDHLGTIYDSYNNDSAVFCGANDNASGTALMLNLADTISKIKTKYSFLFIAFGSEEAGLLGSHYYVEHPSVPLQKTKLMINLDLWGYGEEGYVVVAGKEFPNIYEKLEKYTLELRDSSFKVSARTNAPNSDHYFFIKSGVPAVFLYNKGGKYYHDVWDTYDVLTLKGITKIYKVLVKFLTNY